MIGTVTEIKPGDIVAGRYRVEGVLSQGGMGVVLAARHTMLDERVALKLLRPELASDPDSVRRFLREAKAAARIRSEHAVRVLDVGLLEGGSPYIAMELLEGSDLSSLLHREGPMQATRAVDCVLQACEALAEAHALGIVHRDLKPANLFLTRTPGRPLVIKVLDFGISKIPLGDDTGSTASIMGTPRYMSPEQMRSTRSVDARADIWSLGVILYELLSGATPFEADTAPLLCSKVLTEPPRPVSLVCPGLPDDLAAVVMRCLDKNPDLRFARIDALVDALAPFGSEQGRISQKRVALTMTGEPPACSPETPASEPANTVERSAQPTLGPEELAPTANVAPSSSLTETSPAPFSPSSRPSLATPPPSSPPSSPSLALPLASPSLLRLALAGLAAAALALVAFVALRSSEPAASAEPLAAPPACVSPTSAAPTATTATTAAASTAATAATAATQATASASISPAASSAPAAPEPPRNATTKPTGKPAASAPRGQPNGDLYGTRN